MNFFGVGPLELVVILAIALIFVGPERLPRLAGELARTIREIRRYTGRMAADFNEVIQEFEKETEPEQGQWKEIGRGLTDATKSVSDAVRSARIDATAASANGHATAESAPPVEDPGAATTPAPADPPRAATDPEALP